MVLYTWGGGVWEKAMGDGILGILQSFTLLASMSRNTNTPINFIHVSPLLGFACSNE